MEPPLKRFRTFEPDHSESSIAYDLDGCSDSYEDEEAYLEVGDDGQKDGDEDPEQEDPDLLLEQTRAQLDLKLKSKFEAIFEKYGRDFTGIGDEIDLRTGEIVVDNGHLLGMEDEEDDGTEKSNLLESFTRELDDTIDSTEAEYDEQDEVDESHLRLEDMEEDDMILFQNPTTLTGKSESLLPRSSLNPDLQSRENEDDKASALGPWCPSEREILVQFGQDLGPKIARYVSQQRTGNDSAIEPIWRTPDLPPATPGKRLILKSILLEPDSDRSPSPKGSPSVWDPALPRRRKRGDGPDVAAALRGETIIRDRTWYSGGLVSTTVTKQCTERLGSRQSKRTMSVPINGTMTKRNSKLDSIRWARSRHIESSRPYDLSGDLELDQDSSGETVAIPNKRFNSLSNKKFPGKRDYRPCIRYTKADDEALAKWVEEILKQGLPLWSTAHWKVFAEKNPGHRYRSWMDRYRRCVWKKEANPSITQDNTVANSENKSEFSKTAIETVMDSQSESGECSNSDENLYEVSPDVSTNMSETLSGSKVSQTVQGKDLDMGVIDPELLKPVSCLPSIIDRGKRDMPDSFLQQRLQPSQLPMGGASTSCPTSSSMSAIQSARDNSLPPDINRNRNCSSLTGSEMDYRLNKAIDVYTDDAGILIESKKIGHETQTHQGKLSSDSGMTTKGTVTFQGSQVLHPAPHQTLDSSYGFSDDEDDIDLVASYDTSHHRAPDVISKENHIKSPIIDLTIEESAPADEPILDLQAPENPPRRAHHMPISIPSSSPLKILSDVEAEKPFQEPTTPKPPASESSPTLSGILDPDDVGDLHKASPIPLRQFPRGEKNNSTLRDSLESSRKRVISSPAHNPTPKRRSPVSITRTNLLRRSVEASPKSLVVETPGGTKKRCGENDFKCGRGFCFKCLAE